MKRRSFIRYLVGIAATFGVAVAGRLAHASSASDPKIAEPGATPGFLPSKSNVRADGKPLIKVIGIGGAGASAVDHMIRDGLSGVEFVCVDTDAETLNGSSADTKVQLIPGLETGSQSGQTVRDMALTARAQITDVVRGADLIFIIAGMGGNTGTGVAVTVAEVARELGILTVALVTQPMESEGQRLALAENGIAELDKHADTMIAIDNAEIMSGMEDWGEPVTTAEAFERSDWSLSSWVSNIANIVNVPALVGIEFADVCAVLSEPGITRAARTGPTVTCGDDWDDGVFTQSIRTARSCADTAIYWSESGGFKLSGARSILVTVMGDTSLGIDEVGEVMKQIRSCAAPNAKIVVDTIHDGGMSDYLKVSLIAKGFDNAMGSGSCRKTM
jgi:cell division protein FtsZ